MAEDITGLYKVRRTGELIRVHHIREENRYTFSSPELKGEYGFNPEKIWELEKIQNPVLLLINPEIPERLKQFIRSYLEEKVEDFG